MMILSPGLLIILAAIVLPFLPLKSRAGFAFFVPLFALWYIWYIPQEFILYGKFLQREVIPFTINSYTRIFATVFSLALFVGFWFGYKRMTTFEMVCAMVYAGSAIAITFVGDILSFVIYWELMAIFSTGLIWGGGRKESKRAGMRYAVVHILGGVVLMVGVVLYAATHESLSLAALTIDMSMFQGNVPTLPALAGWCLLLGILVNAAVPPLSSWLPDSYPSASPFGSVFLSAFTTKTAIYALIVLFPGNELLIPIGLFMVFYGIVYALVENNIRRILSYSIISQVGLMLINIGVGTQFALDATAIHAFGHIIYKSLLFMSAGAVLYTLGTQKCTELGNLHSQMRTISICSVIAVLAIAFPFTGGFISKVMASKIVATTDNETYWFLLNLATAGVILQGLKFVWFVYFDEAKGKKQQTVEALPKSMTYPIIFLAVLCIIPGIYPNFFFSMLEEAPEVKLFDLTTIVDKTQLLLGGVIVFFMTLPLLKPKKKILLDFDWFFRIFVTNLLLLIDHWADNVYRLIITSFKMLFFRVWGIIALIHGPEGVLARNVPIRTTVLLATGMLGFLLILYY